MADSHWKFSFSTSPLLASLPFLERWKRRRGGLEVHREKQEKKGGENKNQ